MISTFNKFPRGSNSFKKYGLRVFYQNYEFSITITGIRSKLPVLYQNYGFSIKITPLISQSRQYHFLHKTLLAITVYEIQNSFLWLYFTVSHIVNDSTLHSNLYKKDKCCVIPPNWSIQKKVWFAKLCNCDSKILPILIFFLGWSHFTIIKIRLFTIFLGEDPAISSP